MPDTTDALPGTKRRQPSAGLVLLGAFLGTIGLILYIWWPLAQEVLAYIDWEGPWWLYIDWLLIGIFLFMCVLIVSGADLARDSLIILVGAAGGLVIEAWGTQTSIWTYYTFERPPLWIIPAWPIASLTIDRMVRLGSKLAKAEDNRAWRWLYWPVFPAFLGLMVVFVSPTLDKPFTWVALLICITLIITPTSYKITLLNFAAGAGLGYFLELWGTTRQCWTYYTLETPPVFAVLAHGMAAVTFWRAYLLISWALEKIKIMVRAPQT